MPSSTFTAEAYPMAGLSSGVDSSVSGFIIWILVGRTLPSVPTTSNGVLTPSTTSSVSPWRNVLSKLELPLLR